MYSTPSYKPVGMGSLLGAADALSGTCLEYHNPHQKDAKSKSLSYLPTFFLNCTTTINLKHRHLQSLFDII